MSQFPPSQPHPIAEPPPQQTSGLAIAALVVGILGVVTFCSPIGLVALILGIVALGQIGGEDSRVGGRGMAIAGIILGTISLLLGIVALMIGMMLPALGAARTTARQMQNNTQIRGVHQALVMYAQGNQSNFPGLSGRGEATTLTDGSVAGRLQVLLDNNYFTGEYLVSPSESLTPGQPGVPLRASNYSYALLEISEPGGRRDEWRETLNTEAVAISDRNAGDANDVYSVHTSSHEGWRGAVGYNDNHVVFESTHVVPTKYGHYPAHRADHLFVPAGTDDAWMVHGDGGPERSALEPTP